MLTVLIRNRRPRYPFGLWLIGLLAAGSALLPAVADAGSYQVQASVPYAVPTQAAVFSSGLDGTTVHAALQTVTGSCEQTNPLTTISVWRSGEDIGSVNCISGAFSLDIMLLPGSNSLTARSANASGLYGPDSQTITINLILVAATPSNTGDGQSTSDRPQTAPELVTATNLAATTGLIVTTTQPFSIITSDATVSIQLVVSGGNNPYALTLTWGDGSQESHTVAAAGTYTYSHTYRTATNYHVQAGVRDASGAYSVFNYAVVSYRAQPGVKSPSTTIPTGQPGSSITWLPAILASVVLGGLLFSSLGYHVAVRRMQADTTRTAAVKRKRSTKKAPGSKR